MKVWIKKAPDGAIGGPASFIYVLSRWLENSGASVTGDFSDRDIDVALAVCTIESPELRTFKRRRIPIIQRIDGLWFNTPDIDFEVENARLKRCYEVADAVIFQSRFSKKIVETTFGAPGCESRIIYNGVDTELFKPSESRRKIGEGNVRIACSSVWKPQKRLGDTIKGFLRYQERHPGCRLEVIGPTNTVKDELIEHPAIICHGSISHGEMAEIYRNCHLFMHLNWIDCCPNSVIEAQAAGLPVICSNAGGTRELVENRGGFVIECDTDAVPSQDKNIQDRAIIPNISPDKIAEAIESVVSNLEERTSILKRDRHSMSIERAAGEYQQLFEDMKSGAVKIPWGRGFLSLAMSSVIRKITFRRGV